LVAIGKASPEFRAVISYLVFAVNSRITPDAKLAFCNRAAYWVKGLNYCSISVFELDFVIAILPEAGRQAATGRW